MRKLLSALFLFGAFAAALLPSMVLAQDKVPAPPVTLLSRLDAISKLEEQGFTFELKFIEDPCNLSDIVVEQFPTQGTPVDPGAEFTLTINTAHGVKIPKFTGLTRAKAAELANQVGVSTVVVDDVVEVKPQFSPSGRICEWWPIKREYISQIVRNQNPREGVCTSLGTSVSVHLPVREERQYIVVCNNCDCP